MRVLGLGLVLALGLLSCSTTLHPVTARDTPATLAFLRDGETTEAQVIERLGQPARRFPDGVVVYRLGMEKKLLRPTTGSCPDAGRPWPLARSTDCYDLVLVFDASRILRVHSLLRVQ